MPNLYKYLDAKRFNELDEADRNIRTQVMINDAKHIEQFDSPMKFQNKFEKMTAYQFTRGLELFKEELEGIINDYNNDEEEQNSLGKLINKWNILMAYLKNMLLGSGGISNRDIQKINNLLDELKPLVDEVSMIAEEKDFVDVAQVKELAEKFDGNNWTPVKTVISKKKSDEVVEEPEVEDELDEDDDEFGLDNDEQPDDDDEEPDNKEPDDEEPDDEKEQDEEEPDQIKKFLKSKRAKYQTILNNLMESNIEQLRSYHKDLFNAQTLSDDKYYLRNKIRTQLNKLMGNGKPSKSKSQGDYLKSTPAPVRYNDTLDDYYLYHQYK